jgi:hypothetical protein
MLKMFGDCGRGGEEKTTEVTGGEYGLSLILLSMTADCFEEI